MGAQWKQAGREANAQKRGQHRGGSNTARRDDEPRKPVKITSDITRGFIKAK